MLGIVVFALVLLGTPIFAVMGGFTELAWLTHANPDMRWLRFLAPDVLDERFAGNPVLVTVPLFTFLGYMLAASKAPQRIVRAAEALLGWLPGGLAIVCILASAFFTTFTGGSAVTIVAIGALLYPTMVQKGYPEHFALGLVTTSGSVGLLLPPSLPILVYSLFAGIDFAKAFKTGIAPGLLILVLLSAYAAFVAVKHGIPRTPFAPREAAAALWELKWELTIPVLILGGLTTGLANIDEIAALSVFYAVTVELFVHRDLKPRDFPRIARNAIGLAGGLLLIMAFAMSLTNYMISEQLPDRAYTWLSSMGIRERWQFLVALNLFLYVMVMDGISMIIVSVPLVTPFAARFGIQPFHMCVMFLLNMEVCNLTPPFGQNVFIASYRFNRPTLALYRYVAPFLAVMVLGLLVVDGFPRLSTFAVEADVIAARAKAALLGEPPFEAWALTCVQEDRNDIRPCTEEESKKWGIPMNGMDAVASPAEEAPTKEPSVTERGTDAPSVPAATGSAEAADEARLVDELMK
jgi:tripartite ATP-independent transporter DctM subunit